MRRSLAVMLWLIAGQAWAQQTASLEIKGGDVKVVKVDKVITIKTDLTIVSSFPFTVQAPAGAAFYFWQFPSGVVATDKGDVLEVTAAPNGPTTVSVKLVAADWDAKKFITQFGAVSFAVGGVPDPPEPPTPPDDGVYVPVDLMSSIQAAYALEPDPLKVDRVKKYADLLSTSVSFLRKQTTVDSKGNAVPLIKTHADFDQKMHAAAVALLGGDEPARTAIVVVRTAISNWTKSHLPQDANGAADDAYWEQAKTVLSQEAKALRKAVK